MWMWLAVGLAGAGEDVPMRCEAVFIGPVKGCDITAQWTTSGFGRDESEARENAVIRLKGVADSALRTRALRAAGTLAEATTAVEALTCPQAVADLTRIWCSPEPTMSERQFCFASYPERDCYRGTGVDLSLPGWKAQERGRDKVCAAMEDEPLWARLDEIAHERCRMGCLEDAAVSCTPES